MNRLAGLAKYLPLMAVIIGFAMVALGWNGAASIDYAQGQLPYLISGGVAGLGFIFLGSAAMVIQALKEGQSNTEEALDELSRHMKRVASSLTFSQNGKVADAELVVIGSSSFHLPSCRMVGKKPDLVMVPKDEAESEGFEPCRICEP